MNSIELVSIFVIKIIKDKKETNSFILILSMIVVAPSSRGTNLAGRERESEHAYNSRDIILIICLPYSTEN